MHPEFLEASITIFLATSLALHTLVHGRSGRSRRLFLALLGSILVWAGGVAMSRVVNDPQEAVLAVHIAYLGVFTLPPIWYAVAVQLTQGNASLFSRGRLAILFAPSLVSGLVMLTNPWHGLFMRDPSIVVEKSPIDWAGPAFWVWTFCAYALVFGGSIRYVAWSWQLVSRSARWRGGLVCVASLLPLSGNFLHIFGVTPPGHDFTLILLGVSIAMFFVADWRFQLLDTLPVARKDVIEQLRDGVIVADTAGVILDMNPAAEHLLNARLADLVGKPIVRAIAEQSVGVVELDEAGFERAVARICNSSDGFETTVENLAGRYFEVRGAGVKDSGGQIAGLYIIVRDITERSRFEEVQRDSRRAQTIASLAAGITHEVNNPLSYVRANISHVIHELSRAFDKEDVSVDELRSVLEEALEGADRIGTIVERVRRFTDKRSDERESISIPRIFEEISRIRSRPSEPAIEIESDEEADLGQTFGSHDGLLEAVRNLVDNARIALEEQGGTIKLRARRHGRVVRIEVEDDGPGVAEDLRKKIFEPFFTTRAVATSAHGIGTGLGLSISAKLVSDFGGTLSYEPVPAGGARFVIELPDGSRRPKSIAPRV